MKPKFARAEVNPRRQRTQYTCVATSTAMCLHANGIDTDEDEVNRVLGARPMQGASWENVFACAQHYGMRVTFLCPATLRQVKEYTDRGIPVMIAWNPEGRPWSHASVIIDVTDDFTVHVADPNIPDPDETVRIVPKDEFYSKWYEKWPNYLVRRPAVAIEREITVDGRQVVASKRNPMDKKALDTLLARFEEEAGVETDLDELRQLATGFSIDTDEDAEKKRAAGIKEGVRDKFGPVNVASDGVDREARVHGGLYGFTKRTQGDCESAIGKLSKAAVKMAKAAYRKDERSARFLKTHADRSSSLSAQILVAAMENMGPKFATEDLRGKTEQVVMYDDAQPLMERQAGRRRLGLYGYPHKVARLGLDTCSSFRNEANKIAMDLHRRRADRHGKITGFFGQHSKDAGCKYSSALLRYYPEAGAKLGSYVPQTMEEWLDWEE